MDEEELTKMFAASPISLAPTTIREWMIHFHSVLDAQAKNAGRLEEMILSLKQSREIEYACPFNPAIRGQNGQKLLDRVRDTEDNISSLKSLHEEVDSLKESQETIQSKLDKQDGAISLLKWIGFPTLAGVAILIIRALLSGTI